MEVLPRGHGGDGGATAVLIRCHGGHGGAAATPLRIGPTRDDTAAVLNMLKVSAVPPWRSAAVLTVFGDATAINDGITAEPRRSRRCHCGLCRTSTAVAPSLRCDGSSTAEARGNMLKVLPCHREGPRFWQFFAVLRGRSMTESLRNYGDHGGATAVCVVQAPQWHRAFGVTGTLKKAVMYKQNIVATGIMWSPK